MFKQTVQQCECSVVETDCDGKERVCEAAATVVGLPNGRGDITAQLAVVSMWDALGGTYCIFYRRQQPRGGWFPWSLVPEEEDEALTRPRLKLTL